MTATMERTPTVLAADTLTGDKVVNLQKENLGKIEHLRIDLESGRVAYAVLSFGGFLGMGDKLFAWFDDGFLGAIPNGLTSSKTVKVNLEHFRFRRLSEPRQSHGKGSCMSRGFHRARQQAPSALAGQYPRMSSWLIETGLASRLRLVAHQAGSGAEELVHQLGHSSITAPSSAPRAGRR